MLPAPENNKNGNKRPDHLSAHEGHNQCLQQGPPLQVRQASEPCCGLKPQQARFWYSRLMLTM